MDSQMRRLCWKINIFCVKCFLYHSSTDLMIYLRESYIYIYIYMTEKEKERKKIERWVGEKARKTERLTSIIFYAVVAVYL